MEEQGTLDKLLNTVQAFKGKDSSSSGKGGWIAAAVTAIIALVLVAIFAWQQWKAGKELAKLLHEKAVREEDLHQAEVDAALEEDRVVTFEALARVEEASGRLEELKEALRDAEERRTSARSAIDKIASWEDVDAIVD